MVARQGQDGRPVKLTHYRGEIWVDLASRLCHVGPTTYEGNLATQFSPAEASAA